MDLKKETILKGSGQKVSGLGFGQGLRCKTFANNTYNPLLADFPKGNPCNQLSLVPTDSFLRKCPQRIIAQPLAPIMKISNKIIFYILILTLFACKQKEKEVPKQKEISTELMNSAKKRQTELPPFELTKTESIANTSKLPDWLNEKNTQIKKDLNPQQNSFIEQFEMLNDSLFSCIFVLNDGTCSEHSIVTYLNKSEVDNLKIGQACDHDQSLPKYRWKEYKMLNSKLIQITDFTEYVHDSIVSSDGWIMDEYLDEQDSMLDSVVSFYKIQQNGKITGANNAYN